MRRGDYRDPVLILMDRENRKCNGCRFFSTERVFDRILTTCGLGRRKVIKCGMYAEKAK